MTKCLTTAAMFCLVLGLGACNEKGSTGTDKIPQSTNRASDPIQGDHAGHVSFYRLLARPEDFDGKLIVVQGVLRTVPAGHIGVGRWALYPTEDAFRNRVLVDSIDVSFSEEQIGRFERLDGEFVALTGTFQMPVPVNEYAHVGVLEPVERLLWLSDTGNISTEVGPFEQGKSGSR